LAATAADTSYSYIYVPPHSARLRWTGQYCPPLIVYYYINRIASTQRSITPATPSPANNYCNYDIPPTVLQLWARGYAISKAQSKGGEITISAVYDVRGSPDVSISFNGNLEIVYHRWIEPFHSSYIDSVISEPYLQWNFMLLLSTYQVLGSVTKSKHDFRNKDFPLSAGAVSGPQPARPHAAYMRRRVGDNSPGSWA
jgi:hypothetical protein